MTVKTIKAFVLVVVMAMTIIAKALISNCKNDNDDGNDNGKDYDGGEGNDDDDDGNDNGEGNDDGEGSDGDDSG